MSKIRIQHVRQPTRDTCVHACLSMVTGIPVDDLVERFGDTGCSNEISATVLCEMGILPILLPNVVTPLFLVGNVFFLTVPSLNTVGGAHCVVVAAHNDGPPTLYDPNEGVVGGQWYPRGALDPAPDNPRILRAYSDVMLLQPLARHHGSRKRQHLYRRRASGESTP